MAAWEAREDCLQRGTPPPRVARSVKNGVVRRLERVEGRLDQLMCRSSFTQRKTVVPNAVPSYYSTPTAEEGHGAA